METYTITEAARLLGIAKRRLYQAVRTGRLAAKTGPKPGDVMTVTAAALKTAGYTLPAAARTPTAASPKAAATPRAAVAPPRPASTSAPSSPASSPPGPEQALVAHLERALEAAQARENRLLDLLAQVTRTQGPAPAAAGAAAPPAASRAATVLPLGSLRHQIMTVLQTHPEGLAPQDVRALLQVDREVRSTMKGMVRSGLLTRLEVGRYVITAAGTPA